jgi:hypothetical protein
VLLLLLLLLLLGSPRGMQGRTQPLHRWLLACCQHQCRLLLPQTLLALLLQVVVAVLLLHLHLRAPRVPRHSLGPAGGYACQSERE